MEAMGRKSEPKFEARGFDIGEIEKEGGSFCHSTDQYRLRRKSQRIGLPGETVGKNKMSTSNCQSWTLPGGQSVHHLISLLGATVPLIHTG